MSGKRKLRELREITRQLVDLHMLLDARLPVLDAQIIIDDPTPSPGWRVAAPDVPLSETSKAVAGWMTAPPEQLGGVQNATVRQLLSERDALRGQVEDQRRTIVEQNDGLVAAQQITAELQRTRDNLTQQLFDRVAERDSAMADTAAARNMSGQLSGRLTALQAELDSDSSDVENRLRSQLVALEADAAELQQQLDAWEAAAPVDWRPVRAADEVERRHAAHQRALGRFDALGIAVVDGVPQVPNAWLVGTNGERLTFQTSAHVVDFQTGGFTPGNGLLLAVWIAMIADPMGEAFAEMIEAARNT